MELGSLIGLIGAIGMIVGAMLSGGGIGPFIDTPSILIVFGGTFRAVHALRLLEGIVYEVETGGDRTFYDVYAALEAAEEACRIARGRVAAKARGRA